jgi:DSF synthase
VALLRPPPGIAGQQYHTLDVTVDEPTETCWCRMQAPGRPSFTPAMLDDLARMQAGFHAAFAHPAAAGAPPFRSFVMASGTPGVFNLGGDLVLFAERIRARDRAALTRYAHATVRVLHANIEAYDAPLITTALVQGDALGGGFECALSFDQIVAERSARFGFPEILFNLFPGMGAYSLLSRRIDPARAQRMILSGRIHTAEELHAMGVIDVLAEDGEGEAAVRTLLAQQRRKHNAHVAMARTRRRVHCVTYEELRDVVDIWVSAALELTEHDLRVMERLARAQDRANLRRGTMPKDAPRAGD